MWGAWCGIALAVVGCASDRSKPIAPHEVAIGSSASPTPPSPPSASHAPLDDGLIPKVSIETALDPRWVPVAWSPDGLLFATRQDDLQIRDGTTGALRARLQNVDRVMWSADGTTLVALMYRGAVVTVRVADGTIHRLAPLEDRARSDFGCAVVDRTATRLVVARQLAVSVWDLASGARVADLRAHDYELSGTSKCAADGKIFATPREDGTSTCSM